MEIYSVVAVKGGVGKTMIVYNFARYLAYRGKKVLVIDKDHQCNISQIFDCDEQIGTVAGIYEDSEVKINNVADNIDLITGNYRLDKVEDWVISQPNTDTRMLMWVGDNLEKGLNLTQYDYILIDTHPDFRTATRNSVVISDKVISPDIPGSNNEESKANTTTRFEECKQEVINPFTRDSFVTSNLYLVGNRIKHNTNSSKKFLEELKTYDNYLTKFDEKELFIEAPKNRTSIDELMKLEKYKNRKEHKEFYNQYKDNFEIIINAN